MSVKVITHNPDIDPAYRMKEVNIDEVLKGDLSPMFVIPAGQPAPPEALAAIDKAIQYLVGVADKADFDWISIRVDEKYDGILYSVKLYDTSKYGLFELKHGPRNSNTELTTKAVYFKKGYVISIRREVLKR